MDIMDFLSSWTFLIIMAVLLIVLIAVFFIVRSRKQE